MLLTKREVIQYSNLPSNFPTQDVINILDVEEYEFRTRLGFDFYELLIADLVDYSASDWATGSYSADDVVIYDYSYYIALEDTSLDPGTSDWAFAPKFTTEKYNTLWPYLAKYLSLCIARQALPKVEIDVSGKGFTQSVGQYHQSASSKAVDRYLSSIDNDIRRALAVMNAFIQDCNDSDYPDYSGYAKKRKNSYGIRVA